MQIHYFQHDEYEDLGCIASWARGKGYHLSCTRFDCGELPPSSDSFDALIVMGGHMGACEDDVFSWLTLEKEAIKQAISQGKIVVGICLGSQLLAAAMGAKVYKNPHPEIGVYPIALTSAAHNDSIFRYLENGMEVLHWHFDTFDLPEGAELMASSAAAKHQAFRLGKNVIALQFHFEQEQNTLDRFIEEGRFELQTGKWIQQESEIHRYKGLCYKNNQVFYQMLDALFEDGKQKP